jgi:hypothetical protein
MSMQPPAAPTEDTEAAAQMRTAGTRAGLAVIAFGFLTAIIVYVALRHSPNSMRAENALGFATMYTAFCAVVGIIVIRWFNRMAPDRGDMSGLVPDAIAPTREQTWERRKGTLGGLLAIAFGLISAMVMYLVDSSSFDFFKRMHAMEFAVLHAFLWGTVGVVMILWHNRQRLHHRKRVYDPNDPLR